MTRSEIYLIVRQLIDVGAICQEKKDFTVPDTTNSVYALYTDKLMVLFRGEETKSNPYYG